MLKHNIPTVVIGASPNSDRYSYRATVTLQQHGHDAYPVGIRKGKIRDLDIINTKELLPNIHTVTLYVRAELQDQWSDYIYSLNPKRVIFNPGTENPKFEEQLRNKGIEAIEACTLIMLSLKHY